MVVLTGTWGVGKTQLAAAYARARLVSGWRLIAWVNARDNESLLAGLAAVAEATGLSVGGSRRGTADIGQAVRRWLEADGSRCLLVFDDAEDPGLLRPFVPAVGAARVLITLTRKSAAELGTSVSVGAFSAGEALTLLDGRTGLADEAGASAVAAELGHLPLALDQAAVVIAGQHLGYAAYLAKLRALPVEDYLVRGEDQESQPYPPGVAEAVLLLHCLVARVVRGRLARRGRLATAFRAAASAMKESAEALAKPRDHATVTEMLGQVTALLENAGALTDNADEKLARVLMRVRFLALYHLIELGDSMPHAIAIGEPLTADLERLFGPSHPDTLNARNNLAAAYQSAGRTTEAILLFEQTLAGRERLLGPDHPDSMRSRNDLARAYREAGRVAEAVPLVERTLGARERLLGADHPSTLASRNNLASAYQAVGRPAEAIALFEKNVDACERLLGGDHPNTLHSRGNLAAAYWVTDRVAEAIPLLEQTLAGQERVLGVGHPDTQATRNNLDSARRDAGLAGAIQPADQHIPDPALTGQPAAGQVPAEEVRLDQVPAERVPDEKPAVEESPAEGPPAEDAPADEVAAEEPAAEEIPAEESPAEEPLAEQVPAELVPAENATEEAIPVVEPEQSPRPESVPEKPTEAADQGSGEDASCEPASVPEPEPEPEPEPVTPRLEPAAGPARISSGRPARKRLRVLLVAVIVILLVAGGVTFALSRHYAGHPSGRGAVGGGQAGGVAADPAQMAAEWVSQQVSQSVIVACDPLMCSILEARGVSAARLLVLRTTTANPLGAEVVVATPAVRSQFGSRLDSVYAPSVIAGFGSGPDHVDVQVVARHGAAAYLAALRQDMAARKAAGTQLLANKRIRATAQARTQLAAGEVDSRLLLMLPALAATHPIQILAFGDSGPGAGPGVPLCSANLSGSGQAAGMTDTSYLSWLTSFVRAQLAPFSGSMAVLRQGNHSILRVEFAKPSPLGLLTHG